MNIIGPKKNYHPEGLESLVKNAREEGGMNLPDGTIPADFFSALFNVDLNQKK